MNDADDFNSRSQAQYALDRSIASRQQLNHELRQSIHDQQRNSQVNRELNRELAEKNEEIEKKANGLVKLIDSALNLKIQNEELYQRVQSLENLLAQPMLKIAAQNNAFKATYDVQQEILYEWMVSQDAFRALASKYAKELNISEEQWSKAVEEKRESSLAAFQEKNQKLLKK